MRPAAMGMLLPDELLVGFTGPSGAGKDTCAAVLAPFGFRRLAFADALRDEVARAWRVDVGVLTDRSTKEWPISGLAIGQCDDPAFIGRMAGLCHPLNEPRSPRWICQRWGTEYRRAQDDEYWVSRAMTWVRRQRGTGCRRLVITDVRYANEAAAIRQAGGYIVRVHRPGLRTDMASDTAGHASELDLISVDAEVNNDGGTQALQLEVVRVLQGLRA